MMTRLVALLLIIHAAVFFKRGDVIDKLTALGAWEPVTTEPNPPIWPGSVVIFAPGDNDIESKIASAYAEVGGETNHGQFSSERFAFLFKQGTYDVDVPVGYYTHVMGLGATPSEVTFTSSKGVYSEAQAPNPKGALCTFWRIAENFKTMAAHDWGTGRGMLWAVSQAAPIRRVEVANDLMLTQHGSASGGFLADIEVGGTAVAGSQQQWFTRDSTVGAWSGGSWNVVFTGVVGAPTSHCGRGTEANRSKPVTTVDATPTIAEKPFITADADGRFALALPPLKENSRGADLGAGARPVESVGFESVDFERVYVASPADTAAIVNAKLAQGLHIVFSPGIYQIEAPLEVETTGQVLLGLGLATLVSSRQNVLVQVGDVDGVRIAGLLLQAGPLGGGGERAAALLVWGSGGYAGSAERPGLMHDVFARVGGPDGGPSDPVAVGTMVHIRSGHVIGDNLWLWRADHVAEGDGNVSYSSNFCEHGLVVDGDDVTMYGLFVEHAFDDGTLWNGERGRTYLYQSELPYTATKAQFGQSCGYRVAPTVRAHSGWGVGVYAFFKEHNVTVASGIVCPRALEANFVAPLSFGGKLAYASTGASITHVINDLGPATHEPPAGPKYVC